MSLFYRVIDPQTGHPTHAVVRDGRFCRVETPFEALVDVVHGDRELAVGDELGPEGELEVLAPVAPSKVVCIGLNYQKHAEEMNKTIPDEPLMFMKPPTAVIGPGDAIELPAQSELVHHEGELAVVIGKRSKRLEPEESSGVILGYTCANDVTARDIQRREKRYTRGKGFDTFCPLGPAVATADNFLPAEHTLVLQVDGQERQRSQLNDFIFGIEYVVAFVSQVMTLEAGDVILTGTPHGVGPLEPGNVVSVEIDGIGRLENPVE
ncbi:fumarylacetoacetate hydrolase family protein [Persicimonas caeni]|uniref:Fumarylacetoacetate hydrolase family protein n=1 Tax=Persicimonas caeni TaxID=2292766 RepID=A0A4Y6PUP7_PERCE|nr:fumarylacetoacetate hydrolase family protein [Persicimonas caeni]QDG51829.1 fumarylacetoacetate hydrolase family protein [Persicimonas caeni]QED33050.1 fumarylacetoacetate hydrolase family protein [Persicimonas caeni]